MPPTTDTADDAPGGDLRSSEPWAPGQFIVNASTYNEQENIAALIDRVLAARDDLHMLVVDDDSPDGTGRIAHRPGPPPAAPPPPTPTPTPAAHPIPQPSAPPPPIPPTSASPSRATPHPVAAPSAAGASCTPPHSSPSPPQSPSHSLPRNTAAPPAPSPPHSIGSSPDQAAEAPPPHPARPDAPQPPHHPGTSLALSGTVPPSATHCAPPVTSSGAATQPPPRARAHQPSAPESQKPSASPHPPAPHHQSPASPPRASSAHAAPPSARRRPRRQFAQIAQVMPRRIPSSHLYHVITAPLRDNCFHQSPPFHPLRLPRHSPQPPHATASTRSRHPSADTPDPTRRDPPCTSPHAAGNLPHTGPETGNLHTAP